MGIQASSTHVSEELKLTQPSSRPAPQEGVLAETEGPCGASKIEADASAEPSARADSANENPQRL